jgi:glycosyltransferase involved in cell wall biosynthesis
VLYTGTFEPYQGLEMLVESARKVVDHCPDALFLMVGGKPDQVRRLEGRVEDLGLAPNFHFTGLRPPEDIPTYVAIADVLVSPRTGGTNTPLKIYSYLRSGKPIVATDLYTHTQVLDRSVSVLTEPVPDAFADGVLSVLKDPSMAKALGERARRVFEDRHSFETFVQKTDRALRMALG